MGIGSIDEYDYYLDKLIALQYQAAEMFEHMPSRGKVREQFIIEHLNNRFHLNACRGFVTGKTYQSNQCDVLVPTATADMRGVGEEYRLFPQDVIALIEVKSTLKPSHLKKLNSDVEVIKQDNPDLSCGIFAYRLNASAHAILARFGFDYDEDSDIYTADLDYQLLYPHIDFVISTHEVINEDGIQEDYSFFIQRNNLPGQQKYVLLRSKPVTTHFFKLIHSLQIADSGRLQTQPTS